MKIGLAQLAVIDYDLEANFAKHVGYIIFAKQHDVDLLVFPELSLCGYIVADLKKEVGSLLSDSKFDALKFLSVDTGISVVAGTLINDQGKNYISSVILSPDETMKLYKKQYLHGSESMYICPGLENVYLSIGGKTVAIGICSDFASKDYYSGLDNQVNIIVFSSLISSQGYERDIEIIDRLRQDKPVLIANYVSNTGGWQGCGQSTFIADNGLSCKAPSSEEGLLVVDIDTNGAYFAPYEV